MLVSLTLASLNQLSSADSGPNDPGVNRDLSSGWRLLKLTGE